LAALQPARWIDMPKAAELIQDLAQVWAEATDPEKQQLLRGMLEAVVLDDVWAPYWHPFALV
jgi:hypothetical protein